MSAHGWCLSLLFMAPYCKNIMNMHEHFDHDVMPPYLWVLVNLKDLETIWWIPIITSFSPGYIGMFCSAKWWVCWLPSDISSTMVYISECNKCDILLSDKQWPRCNTITHMYTFMGEIFILHFSHWLILKFAI